ncbi:MAG: hydroxyacylglutathione hydrolase [Burkholderiaceae bacterium]
MTLLPIPAFDDNYIWLLHNGQRAMVVDPGQAEPINQALHEQQLALDTILITHHHGDHIGGVAALLKAHPQAKVYAPAREAQRFAFAHQPVQPQQSITVLNTSWQVLDVAAHTAGHVAYVGTPNGHDAPLLFCGDTLFSAGCGRLFEGSPQDMHRALAQLAALPGNTQVCCAHEYTQSNVRFALSVEPSNQALQAYATQVATLRAAKQPTLPSRIALELEINPFMRTAQPSVQQAASQRAGHGVTEPSECLAVLREWKNQT